MRKGKLCPLCGGPLTLTENGAYCAAGNNCPYARSTMLTPTLGDMFGLYGMPWGQLKDRHGSIRNRGSENLRTR